MTPAQRIRREILIQWCKDNGHGGRVTIDTDAAIVDALFDELQEEWILQDYVSEFREGEEETNIECDWSRHYESKSVARKLSDGTWVGWTYWYGGGKHGEPDAIDWMSDAYELVIAERKMVEALVFAKAEVKP